ncbi:MAG: DUF294 nucleotidyltransferase-like domain-containing protein [Bacteroidota bacterium]
MKRSRNFFLSIILPSLLTILLFVVALYAMVIPIFENAIMERKKEMILELTNTAWSILEENHQLHQKDQLTLEEAKRNARFQVEQMRYGKEQKDYFWIINTEPRMVMHPYRTELNNSMLDNYTDSHGNALFLDALKAARENGEGFIEYYWQWKDDTSRVVPKLSYVKAFPPWDWIIGTGVYLEDVEQEIKSLRTNLSRVSGLIVFIITAILIYIVRQSLLIERKRRNAELDLVKSKQRYKYLVEASTEGTLLLLNNRVTFANKKFALMYNCPDVKLTGRHFDELFSVSLEEVENRFKSTDESVTMETRFRCGERFGQDTVISISRISIAGERGTIVVARNVTKSKILENEAYKLTAELQDSLQLMNQPIKPYIKEIFSLPVNTKVKDAASLMTRKEQKIIFVKNNHTIIGAINDTDLRTRFISGNLPETTTVAEIMSSPVEKIQAEALLYEAVLLFKRKKVSHLLVEDNNQIKGCISNQDCLELQRNTLSYMVEEIEAASQSNDLKRIYQRLPLVVNNLLTSGDTIRNINRVITSVSDAISIRVIELTEEHLGQPPCPYVFIAMGSEGRCEQTLNTDQDNAIIFQDHSTDNQHYFLELGKRVNQELHKIGYKRCEGEIMAGNPKWCQPLSVWKRYFTDWINTPEPQSVLESTIFFDFRAVSGENSLAEELRKHINIISDNNHLFFYHMADAIIKYKPAYEGNMLNLKKVMLPLVGFIRIYALKHKLWVTNSTERLENLVEKNALDETRHCEIENMFNSVMLHRIRLQVQKIMRNEPPDNVLHIKNISKIEQAALSKILSELHELQNELVLEFRHG